MIMNEASHEEIDDSITVAAKDVQIDFRQLVESSPVAMYTTDVNGYISFCNHAAIELWGREPLKGKDLSCGSSKMFRSDGSLLPLEESPVVLTLHNKHSLKNVEIMIETTDGKRKKVLACSALMRDGQGETIGTINTLVELTNIKTTDDSAPEQALFENDGGIRLAWEASNLGTWDIDLASGSVKASEMHRTILGYDGKENWSREKFYKRVHPEDLADVMVAFEHGLMAGKFRFEARIAQPMDQFKWIRIDARTLYDSEGRPLRILGTMIDIDDQKLQNDALEKTVAERTSALQKAKEKLERSNQELEQFAYIASHDLQEPLRKIQTFSSLLSKHIDKSPDAARYFEKINSSAQRMSVLIRDVLHYSRLSCSDDVLVETSLAVIVNSVVNDYELLILEKNAEVRIGYLPKVMGVTHQLHQLSANIISNALKFSSAHPLIEIFSEKVTPGEIRQYPELKASETYVKIVFKDNGIGFEQKFAEQIFTIFQRLNTRESYKGTGIGLAICKRIVESHGGVIYAISDVGKGASFNVILPAIP
jgi:PAS domain S-box-containing protein